MIRRWFPLVLLVLAAAHSAAARADAPSAAELLGLSDAERAALVQRTPRSELAAFLRATSVEDLLALGRRSLSGLGVYGARLVKRERVKGELLDPQTLQLVVRDQPLAARVAFIEGPAKGRRLLYNAELRAQQLRVREGGFFGLMAIWIDLDSSLTRRDTNHRATDLGFASLVALIQRDVDRARPRGGFTRTDEGFDERGAYCMLFEAPKGAEGLMGDRSRICIDAALGLPVRSEVYLRGDLLESYSFEKVTPKLQVPADYFTPDAAGL